MIPEPLRPPSPVGPPPRPPGNRRWLFAAAIVLLAIVLPTALLMFHAPSGPLPTGEAAAEQFVQGISRGSSPADGAGGRTGFQAAYELMAASKREALPFDVFFDEWRRVTDAHGMIVDAQRTSEVPRENWMHARRDIIYVLYIGGENQDHAALDTIELRMTMAWDRKDARFVIADYARSHVTNPRATR